MIKVKQLINSFYCAGRGIKSVFLAEQSFRLQSLAGLAVIVLSLLLPLQTWERILLLLLVGLVLVLELINSVFERLVDGFKPRLNPLVGEIKDIIAGAVLLASTFAAVIGLIILLPHLLDFFQKIS